MDPFTQGLLGATIGQFGFRARLGRAGIVAGALVAMTPDLDLLPAMIAGAGPLESSLQHRGLTHSVLFSLIAGPAIGGVLWLVHRRFAEGVTRQDLAAWIGLAFLAFCTHGILDSFTSYGTQLLAPLSNARFALDAVGVIDPFYTLPLLAVVVYGLLPNARPVRAMVAAGGALTLTTAYLFYGIWLNGQARAYAEDQLAADGVVNAQVRAYPTLFQPFLRRIVAQKYPDIWVGYLTMWNPEPIRWDRFTPPEHPILEQLGMSRQAYQFYWFAMGQTTGTLRRGDNGVLIAEMHDMRYGMPGQPQRGLWALQATIRHGELIGEIKKVFFPRPLTASLIAQLYKDAFALEGRGNRAPYSAPGE